jgi:predicted acylesterase/phospholipase RssA
MLVKADLAELIESAKNALRGEQATAEQLSQLAKALKAKHAFDYARRVLQKALDLGEENQARRRKIVQQLALCISKDRDIPHEERFSAAMHVLQPELDRAREYVEATSECQPTLVPEGPGAVQETLGIAGGIYKRRWQATGGREDLLQSLQYYLAGYRLGIHAEQDQGYTAINAAFVLDLLAERERREADKMAELLQTAHQRREQAKKIRQEVVGALEADLARERENPPADEALSINTWWVLVTVAEAYFGLRNYEKAREYLLLAKAKEVDPWEYEATVRQLAQLAGLIEGWTEITAAVESSPPWQLLQEFVGPHRIHGVRTAFAGKLGLALSGGGFRASLFHIGVLARLAELDLLRHVDVLSCVSGGSIVGAHYYLLLRNLLQEKRESELGRDDYIRLVDGLEKEFMAFVQTNPRMGAFANAWRCLKSIWFGAWRPTAFAQVLESDLYGPAAGHVPCRLGKTSGVPFCELFIHPTDEDQQFQPRQDNWRRKHKVPMLVLNATALNTGHNWQFTASWFGEPPAGINPEVDGNERLRRMYYHEAPHGYRCLTLAQAVSSSAAVPGIFWPVTFKRLYEGRRIVRLVDGGVFDNQGTTALLDEECTLLIVSDASGQLPSERNPSLLRFPTLYRTQSVFMERIRGAEYGHLSTLSRSGLLRDFAFLHLKKDLESSPVDWLGCDNPKQPGRAQGVPLTSQRLTSYGIRADIQRSLSGIRTDLDAFCDAEAFALMTSGYRMAGELAANRFGGLAVKGPAHAWRFLDVEPLMKQTHSTERFERVLGAASNLFFKCFLVHGIPKWLVLGCLALLSGGAVWLIERLIRVVYPAAGVMSAAVTFLAIVFLVWLLGLLRGLSRLGDVVYLRYLPVETPVKKTAAPQAAPPVAGVEEGKKPASPEVPVGTDKK